MGYYTRFSLKAVDKDGVSVDSAIDPAFDAKDLYEESISLQELIENSTDSMKWYDHKEDMLAASRLYPEYVFVLDGFGEEGGDIWREFYKNGKFYRWEPKIEPPEFSRRIESKMEE